MKHMKHMKHKITRKKYRYTRRKRLYRRKKCSYKRMKGGNNQGCVCILLDSLLQKPGEIHPIGWKDKPLGISLSGNSIFEPHEIKKVRMLTSKNKLLSPEDISKYVSYNAITLDKIKEVIPLDDITTKLNEQSASVPTDDIKNDIDGTTYKYISWGSEFTVKTTKYAIEPNRLVYCEMVNGKATITINIGIEELVMINISIDITYRIIVDLDGIIQCVVVDYTIKDESKVQYKDNIKNGISSQVKQNLKARLQKDPNSFLTTIPLKLEVPLDDTPSAPQVVNDSSLPGLWIRDFSKDTNTNGANKMTYTSPSPIQKAAFERVQKYIQSTVSWNYNDGLCIFRILDSDDKTVAFIRITGMINPEDKGLPKSTKIISTAEFWVKKYFDLTNDKVNMSYFIEQYQDTML